MHVCIYLAGLVVYVESDDSVRGQRSALQQQQVSRQLIGQVGLPCAAGAGHHHAPVLQQQADVVLQHGPRNHGLKHQGVHTLLSET